MAETPSCPGGEPHYYTWEDVQKRCTRDERWLVINRKVYDITRFCYRHPGGARVISHYAGEDATDPFTAFHIDKELVQKHMKCLLIGELAPGEPFVEPKKNAALVEDFRALRSTVEQMGLLKPNKLFFLGALLHILLIEVLGWLNLYYFGASLIPFLITVLLLGTVQAQAGWLQHDFGHLSVFGKSKWNHLVHKFVIGHLKGAPASWWNHLHFQHHAKPNCFRKDPDINMHPLFFALGKKLSVELGVKKKKYMPYNHQHKYFFLIGPPALIPVYFQWYIFYFAVQRKQWADLAWMITFYVRLFLTYVPMIGIGGTITLFFLVRFVESNWFVWVTQMNHIPMHIDYDEKKDWLSTQGCGAGCFQLHVLINMPLQPAPAMNIPSDVRAKIMNIHSGGGPERHADDDVELEAVDSTALLLQATCNVDQSLFNDWFSGHLNFQIEHHLFPTMPRHNYAKTAPLVRSLCKKYGVDYQSKPLFTAFADIVHSLQESGELWLDAYLHK